MSLQNLRQDPRQAMGNTVYYLAVAVPYGPTPCLLGQVGVQPLGFYQLTLVPAPIGGIDFYFPYGPVPQGVSTVAPGNGAIAITTGMNGCALEVVVKNGSYVFYHDTNGNRMGLVQVAGGVGTTVCRVVADNYWDNVWATQVVQQGHIPQYQFLCVFRGNFWHVGCFRFATTPGLAPQVVHGGPGLGLNGSYIGYFNQTVSLKPVGPLF